MSILDRTTNFIELFVYSQGHSEVPKSYFLWCAVSLLAAAVGKNIGFQKILRSRKKMYPNLYVILLGDSASGKGIAIEEAEAYADCFENIGKYRGAVTRASIVDNLSSARLVSGVAVRDARLYLLTPELGQAIKTGTLADEFVKFMTDIFTGGGVQKESTRMHGVKIMRDPCVNWLAGTTKDWLLDSISPSAISGGFFGRVIVVQDEWNPKLRIHEPACPVDAPQIRDHLSNRIAWLSQLRGYFVRTPEAVEVERGWYENREGPTDERLRPIWKRSHDIVIKLSMILCLAETLVWDQPGNMQNRQLVIQAKHAAGAIDMLTSVRAGIDQVINLSSVTGDTRYFQMVRDAIEKTGVSGMAHSNLLRKFSGRGLSADSLYKIVRTLEAGNQIEPFNKGRAIWYRWMRMRKIQIGLEGGDE